MAYTGSIDLISGIRQKNGGNFPLLEASAVQVGDDPDVRLPEYLNKITEIQSVDALPENPDPNVLYLIREEDA